MADDKNDKATNDKTEKQPDSKENKEGRRLFKFVFNMTKKTDDHTEMTADFIGDVQHYIEYDDAVSKCVQILESCYTPVGGKPTGQNDADAFQKLYSALQVYREDVQLCTASSVLDKFADNMKKASAVRKSHQVGQKHVKQKKRIFLKKEQKYQLRHLRRFHVDEFQKFLAQRKAFDESRRRMDQAKADVRDAKTTAQIEKKAICYQMAVDDFDVQTETLIKWIDGLPKNKAANCRDILMVLMKHKLYHDEMNRLFSVKGD